MKKYLWLVAAAVLLLAGGYYLYYQNTVHDISSCRKAGGKSGGSNENFYCQLNGKYYWSRPDISW